MGSGHVTSLRGICILKMECDENFANSQVEITNDRTSSIWSRWYLMAHGVICIKKKKRTLKLCFS